jgi:superfamily II DNA or RNA helicase
MLTIEFGPVYSHLTSDSPREQKEAYRLLHHEMTFWAEGYFYSPRYQAGLWDGREHFFTPKGRFLSGLLAKILKLLADNDFEAEVEGYPDPHELAETLETITLGDIVFRGYQMDTVKRILHYHRGIVKVATNGGKTEIMAGLLQVLGVPPSMILVPRKVLLPQTAKRLEDRLQIKVGMVGDSIWKPNWSGVTVAMYQTLTRRLKDSKVKKALKTLPVVIGDECHFVRDAAYQKSVNACRNAEFRIGMSGTPFPEKYTDRLSVTGHFGPVLSDVSNAELIELGVSARPNILFVEPKCTAREVSELKFQSDDFALLNCETRNRIIADAARAFVESGRQTVVLCRFVKHALAIHKHFPEAEVAYSNSKNKKEVLRRLESGEVFCLICTSIFNTGLSVDYIEAMIMAGGGKAPIDLLQGLGRALRQIKGRDKSLWVMDLWDTFNRYTKSHSKGRMDIYKKEQAFHITEDIAEAPAEVRASIEMLLSAPRTRSL